MSHCVRPLLLLVLAASAAACATAPTRVELVPPGPAPAGDPLDLVLAGRKVRCHVNERVGDDHRPVSSQDCSLTESLQLSLPPGSYEVVVEIPCQAKAVAAFTVGDSGAPVRVPLPRPPASALPRFVTVENELPALPGSGSAPLRVKRGEAVTVVRLWQDAAGACTGAVIAGPGGGLLVSSVEALSRTAPAAPTVKISSTTDPTGADRKAAGRSRAKRQALLERLDVRREEVRAQAAYPKGTTIHEARELCALYGPEATARVAQDLARTRLLKANRAGLRGQTFYLLTSFRPGGGEILRADAGCDLQNRETIEVRFKPRRRLVSPSLFPAETEWLALATLEGTSLEPGPGGEAQLPILRLIGLVKLDP